MSERPSLATARRLPKPVHRSTKNRVHHWARWMHVYTSMLGLLVVLFFGLTGITLNHPNWVFGDEMERTTLNGTLPSGMTSAGNTDFLAISEHLRTELNVKGTIAEYGLTGDVGLLSYKAPGYAADLNFSAAGGQYNLAVEQQGFVAVMNDLHKGRDTGSAWKWVIDLSGALLAVVAGTGLTIQFFLRKRRRRALVVTTLGAIFTVAAIMATTV
ncbi:MAG: PepSY-associated TM helix domain-containing protein [Acidimicrobiales bacterium]